MPTLPSTVAGFVLAGALLLGAPAASASAAPLRVLYVTNYNAVFHDFRAQGASFARSLPRYAHAQVDVVGEERAALEAMRTPGFASPYDAVVYNFCLAANSDEKMVANLIAETRDRGVPAVLLHCAMHSFQVTAGRTGLLGGPHVAWPWARSSWAAANPAEPYPVWWQFTGIDSNRHDFARRFGLTRAPGSHPVTVRLPATWSVPSDELYRNMDVMPGVTPLYSAYSVETRRDHVVAWAFDAGGTPIVATTLGHSEQTLDVDPYQQLVANSVLWVTGHLDATGVPQSGFGGTRAR